MNGDRTPFAVTVTLPRGRNYSTQTEIALAESSAFGGAPDRVTVQLPPAGIAETTQLLSDYARTWGFPESAVAQWREDAEARAGSDRAYSTHVFTPDDVGHVHLEFQVSHHVRDGYFVTAALFSWNPINGRPGNGPPS